MLSKNPAALTPLLRLRRIIPETRRHLLQKGPGQLPRHGGQTHRPRPLLFEKRERRVALLYRPLLRQIIAKVAALKALRLAVHDFSTPPAANPGASLAPTATSPTSPIDNSGDIFIERPVDATPRMLHPTPLISKLGVSTTSPPAAFSTSPTDNSGDGTREITRGKDHRSLPLTTLAHNPGALRTPTSAALTTSPTDNPGDGLMGQDVLNASQIAKSKGRTNLATTSPTENSGDATPGPILKRRGGRHHPTPPPMPLTDNPGDSRHQSAHFRLHVPGFLDVSPGPGQQSQLTASNHHPPSTVRRASERRTVIQSPGRWIARPIASNNPPASSAIQEPTMATPGVNLEALANLQADEIRKLIKSLQGLAAARTGKNTAPTAPQPPPIPATTVRQEEAILWEQVGTGNTSPPEVPPIRPPPPHNFTQGQKMDELANPSPPLLPPKSASTFAETCSKQQRENSLDVYPVIFDLPEDGSSTSAERMSTLAYLS